MASRLVVVYDACVLYPAPLRDLLMQLALTSLFQAKWTNAIHEEWIRNLLIQRPDLERSQLERTRELMNQYTLDCLVEGYEYLIPTLRLPDENDQHVLAAAIHASASIIVTYNLKDFPLKATRQYAIEATHPDDFILQFLEVAPGNVCTAIHKLRTRLKNPPIDVQGYLEILQKQSLVKTVNKLQQFSTLL